MSFQLNKWSLFCCLLAFQINNGFCSSINGDTLRLDINSSYFSGSYVEIPVTFSSVGNVYSVDMAFRFNTNRLMFDDVVNPSPGLQYLYYLNPNDSVWRFTSYNPSGLLTGPPICHLRFLSLSNEACAYDFDSQEGYINGDSCNIEIQGCMDNVGFGEWDNNDHGVIFPNPFSEELNILTPPGATVHVYGYNGVLLIKSISILHINAQTWPDGLYIVRIDDGEEVRLFKALKYK